ncbi:MAG: peptidyl-prolyl cis-trans isomerase [Isosphaeraceae bacterium]|jgi:cyclophilin family peptidyl-prolyl cis-trans isomerase|nr:MAG: peptidyl-prolyl cis-trans isomerase [Isosphaeraceae bacterium]
MLNGWILLLVCLGVMSFGAGVHALENPVVVIDTTQGTIEVELDAAKAPITVENFLKYVDQGHYDGTIFHRVIKGFMIQGGGLKADMSEKPTGRGIQNESTNGLKNARGTIAMARTSDPNSATAQFFINLVDNDFLNGSPNKPGYAVFGRVIAGMDVVDKIAAVPTGNRAGHQDVPREVITIKSIRRK